MKRMITKIFAVFILLNICGCSADIGGTAKFPVPKAPEGWEEYRTGPVHLFYPKDGYFEVPSDNELKLANEEQTAYVSVIKEKTAQGDITEIGEEYLKELADAAVKYYDSLYEEAYGLPFDTTSKNQISEVKSIGNGRCVCLSYDIETSATLVAISMTASYYQVVCSDSEGVYTVTFYIMSDDGKRAEEYFRDIIGKMFIE